MTGRELIQWIQTNNAEDHIVVVGHRPGREKADDIRNCSSNIYPIPARLKENVAKYCNSENKNAFVL